MVPRDDHETASDSYQLPITGRSIILLTAALVVLGSLVMPVLAASAASVSADPSTGGATSTHTATLVVDEGIDDFDYFRVDYSAEEPATDVSQVNRSDIVRFGVDSDGDGTIDQSLLTGDWSMSIGGSGHTVRVRNQDWNGTLSPGDVIIIEFEDVQNPDQADTYVVDVVLNGHQTERTTYTVTGDTTATNPTESVTATRTEASGGGGGSGGGSGSGDDSGSAGAGGATTDSPTQTATDTAAPVDDDDSDPTATETLASGGSGDSTTDADQAADADTAGDDPASTDDSGGVPWLLGAGLLGLLAAAAGAYAKFG